MRQGAYSWSFLFLAESLRTTERQAVYPGEESLSALKLQCMGSYPRADTPRRSATTALASRLRSEDHTNVPALVMAVAWGSSHVSPSLGGRSQRRLNGVEGSINERIPVVSRSLILRLSHPKGTRYLWDLLFAKS